MSVDKLVDSTQLDADLTSVANAIRTKGGTSASLAFPADFVSAIAAIPSGGGGLKYDVGDFTLASDEQHIKTANGIAHNLGEVPKCVIIWQTTYTDDNIPAVQVNSGYVFLDRIMDMKQRLTSSASTQDSFFALLSCGANTTVGISFGGPTSATYMLSTEYKPSAEKLGLPNNGASARWRTGVQYHYFVSEAWWT